MILSSLDAVRILVGGTADPHWGVRRRRIAEERRAENAVGMIAMAGDASRFASSELGIPLHKSDDFVFNLV